MEPDKGAPAIIGWRLGRLGLVFILGCEGPRACKAEGRERNKLWAGELSRAERGERRGGEEEEEEEEERQAEQNEMKRNEIRCVNPGRVLLAWFWGKLRTTFVGVAAFSGSIDPILCSSSGRPSNKPNKKASRQLKLKEYKSKWRPHFEGSHFRANLPDKLALAQRFEAQNSV